MWVGAVMVVCFLYIVNSSWKPELSVPVSVMTSEKLIELFCSVSEVNVKPGRVLLNSFSASLTCVYVKSCTSHYVTKVAGRFMAFHNSYDIFVLQVL